MKVTTVNDVMKAQCSQCMYCDIFAKARTPRNLERIYKEEEDTGCTVDYRCTTCAACSVCKKSERLRPISIREEAEEALIAKTTKTDFENEKQHVFTHSLRTLRSICLKGGVEQWTTIRWQRVFSILKEERVRK